jgi:hypothetical protein
MKKIAKKYQDGGPMRGTMKPATKTGPGNRPVQNAPKVTISPSSAPARQTPVKKASSPKSTMDLIRGSKKSDYSGTVTQAAKKGGSVKKYQYGGMTGFEKRQAKKVGRAETKAAVANIEGEGTVAQKRDNRAQRVAVAAGTARAKTPKSVSTSTSTSTTNNTTPASKAPTNPGMGKTPVGPKTGMTKTPPYAKDSVKNRTNTNSPVRYKTGGMVNPNASVQASKVAGGRPAKSAEPKSAAKRATGRSGGISKAPRAASPRK